MAVGDISLGGEVDRKSRNPAFFDLIREEMSTADISIGNLECVLGSKGTGAATYNNLRARGTWAKQLKPFSVLNLANNHVTDFGKEGIDETISLLHKENILTIGAGDNYRQALRPVILKAGSLRIGFLGFTHDEGTVLAGLVRARITDRAGAAKYSEPDVMGLIRGLRKKTHIIVVSIHWGRENVNFPSPKQRILARELVRNGVDIILGHHPHVVQGAERISNGLVFYSLGNFVFDPKLSKTEFGMMVKISLDENHTLDYEVLTTNINEDFEPQRLDDERAMIAFEERCRALKTSSDKVYENWWFEQISETFLRSYRSNVVLIKKFGLRYIADFLLGLVLPFSVKCYAGYIRSKIRKPIGA